MAYPKQAMNMALKLAIIGSGQSQRQIAQRTGVGEVRLSAIVHGRVPATAEEKRDLAKAVGRTQAELFPTLTPPRRISAKRTA